ncbi:MAG: DUF4274 domain-containing protein [Lachnospiraceae bacterium]|nr:DUF4274 domain-containing protein [Lachnospiraceae bacterium]
MEENKILRVRSLLYDCTKEEVQTIISQIEDQEVLYVYAYNYNWDNGFEIPQLILDNDKCDLSIALLIFYRADGISYLLDKSYNGNLSQWFSFIENLYNLIVERKYHGDRIEFKAPLSRVQLFKLKRILTEQETIFIESIEGESLDVTI